MTVYVDDYRGKFGRMVMCHMMSDSSVDELHAMAAKLGLKRSWFQNKGGRSAPHYDICLSKRKQAIELGAKELPIADGEEWRRVHRLAVALNEKH